MARQQGFSRNKQEWKRNRTRTKKANGIGKKGDGIGPSYHSGSDAKKQVSKRTTEKSGDVKDVPTAQPVDAEDALTTVPGEVESVPMVSPGGMPESGVQTGSEEMRAVDNVRTPMQMLSDVEDARVPKLVDAWDVLMTKSEDMKDVPVTQHVVAENTLMMKPCDVESVPMASPGGVLENVQAKDLGDMQEDKWDKGRQTYRSE